MSIAVGRPKRSLKFPKVISGALIIAALGYILYKTHCLPHPGSKPARWGRNKGVDLFGKELQPWELDTSLNYMCNLTGNEPKQARSYYFEISKATTYIEGIERVQTLVNGKYPGEMIEANYGDEIVVTVQNLDNEPTSIHFHGLPMAGVNYLDGVPGLTQCEIQPGASFTYRFLASKSGTYWYHSHSGLQDIRGFVGPVVIHEQQLHTIVDQDIVILITDLYDDDVGDLMSGFVEPYLGGVEPVPSLALLQGKLAPRIFLKPNSKIRARFVNAASYLTYTVALGNLSCHIIEADGEHVFSEKLLPNFPIAAGQRYSAIIWTDELEQAHTEHVIAEAHIDEMEWQKWVSKRPLRPAVGTLDTTLGQNFLAKTDEAKCEKQSGLARFQQSFVELFDSQLLQSYAVYQMPIKANRDIVLDIDMVEMEGVTRGVFNNSAYEMSDPQSAILSQFIMRPTQENLPAKQHNHWTKGLISKKPIHNFNFEFRNGDVVDVLLRNLDEGPHTFHLHGHSFWVVERGSFNEHKRKPYLNTTPVKRDVVYLGKNSYVKIRFVADNPGVWLLHCHNMWHASSGMAVDILVAPEQLAMTSPPLEWFSLCRR